MDTNRPSSIPSNPSSPSNPNRRPKEIPVSPAKRQALISSQRKPVPPPPAAPRSQHQNLTSQGRPAPLPKTSRPTPSTPHPLPSKSFIHPRTEKVHQVNSYATPESSYEHTTRSELSESERIIKVAMIEEDLILARRRPRTIITHRLTDEINPSSPTYNPFAPGYVPGDTIAGVILKASNPHLSYYWDHHPTVTEISAERYHTMLASGELGPLDPTDPSAFSELIKPFTEESEPEKSEPEESEAEDSNNSNPSSDESPGDDSAEYPEEYAPLPDILVNPSGRVRPSKHVRKVIRKMPTNLASSVIDITSLPENAEPPPLVVSVDMRYSRPYPEKWFRDRGLHPSVKLNDHEWDSIIQSSPQSPEFAQRLKEVRDTAKRQVVPSRYDNNPNYHVPPEFVATSEGPETKPAPPPPDFMVRLLEKFSPPPRMTCYAHRLYLKDLARHIKINLREGDREDAKEIKEWLEELCNPYSSIHQSLESGLKPRTCSSEQLLSKLTPEELTANASGSSIFDKLVPDRYCPVDFGIDMLDTHKEFRWIAKRIIKLVESEIRTQSYYRVYTFDRDDLMFHIHQIHPGHPFMTVLDDRFAIPDATLIELTSNEFICCLFESNEFARAEEKFTDPEMQIMMDQWYPSKATISRYRKEYNEGRLTCQFKVKPTIPSRRYIHIDGECFISSSHGTPRVQVVNRADQDYLDFPSTPSAISPTAYTPPSRHLRPSTSSDAPVPEQTQETLEPKNPTRQTMDGKIINYPRIHTGAPKPGTTSVRSRYKSSESHGSDNVETAVVQMDVDPDIYKSLVRSDSDSDDNNSNSSDLDSDQEPTFPPEDENPPSDDDTDADDGDNNNDVADNSEDSPEDLVEE